MVSPPELFVSLLPATAGNTAALHTSTTFETRPPSLATRTTQETPTTPTAVERAAMPPRNAQRGGSRGGFTIRRETDLGALLTASQRDELVLLVDTITNSMLQQVCQIFDQPTAKTIARVPLNVAGNLNSAKPELGTRRSLQDSSKQSSHQQDQSQSQAASIDYATIPPAHGKINPEEGTQADLKKEAVAAFQRWQAAVTKRLSEIVVADDYSPHPTNANPQSSGRPSGRGPLGRASSARFNGSGRGGSSRNIRPDADIASQMIAPRNATDARPQTLLQLSVTKRQLLVHTVLLLLLSLESYPSYSRVLLVRVAAHINVPLVSVAEDEARVAKSLASAAESVWTEDGLLKKLDDGKRERRGRTGTGPGGSAALAPALGVAKIGSVTEGPGIGPAATASLLGNIGTLADGGLAICVFFGMCGVRGAPAKTLDTFTREIQDVILVPLHGARERPETCDDRALCPKDRGLRLTIGISGWLQKDEDDCLPWRVLGAKSEAYALSWEKETMAKVGISLDTVAQSLAWQNAKRLFMNRNVFKSLKSFQWPADLLKISKIVDNPWSVGMVRADKVGIALADAIAHKVPGERGVSLLGYGLGARVIYTCLMSLSERRIFGSVENVIMMGTPAPSSYSVWTAMRSVVVGRVINVFSENDSMLGFLHRTGCVQYGVAGLQRINNVYGIENVDATKPITSHLRYAQLVGRILKDVGWEDLDVDDLRQPEEDLASAETKQEQKPQKQADTTTGQRVTMATKKRRKRPGQKKLEASFQALSIAH